MDQETSLIASPSFVVGFGRRAMESSRKPHAALLQVLDRRMPPFKLVIMGNQQSRWKLEKMFGIRRYIRLSSSSQIEPLLGAEGHAETNYQLFTDDHKADIETIRKWNSVLERKVDDLTRKVNDLLSRNSEYEKDNQAEIERMRRKMLILEVK